MADSAASCVDAVHATLREDGETAPLFVRPKDGNDSLEFLKSWIGNNKKWINQKLLEHGAILFRGFKVTEGIEFEETVRQYNSDLSDQYRGTSPRKLVPGTQYVFTASELPPSYPIPQHLEMSFLPAPPRQLFFCCLVEPTSAGGETCLCDYKKVYDQMDPDIRREFEEKGVIHLRNYGRGKGALSDPSMMKGWEDVFGTTNREEVDRELKSQNLDHSWGKNDSLQVINPVPATENHPVTGDKIWFNHLMVMHWSMFYEESYRVYQRLGQWKHLVYSWMMWLLSFFFLWVMGRNGVGFHTLFGDGGTIPQRYITHVRDLVWKNLVFNRWEKGDVLMIDNFRMSHGRQPYSGQRKIVVAWSQPLTRPSLSQTTE